MMQTIKSARKRGPTLVSKNQVLQVIVDRFCASPVQYSTRQQIADELCVPSTVINDQVDRLKADGSITTTFNGHFFPAHIRADRPMSLTRNPGRESILEIGETCEHLSPGEIRELIHLLGGITRSEVRSEILAIKREMEA